MSQARLAALAKMNKISNSQARLAAIAKIGKISKFNNKKKKKDYGKHFRGEVEGRNHFDVTDFLQKRSHLERLKNLYEQVKWDIEGERYEFIGRLDVLISKWKDALPDLRAIFQKKEIEILLMDIIAFKNRGQNNNLGYLFIGFVVRCGYKDGQPELNEDGKPVLLRITPIHLAARCNSRNWENVIRELFNIYDNFEANYYDHLGLTHFQIACRYGLVDVVRGFLKAGHDPNCLDPETGDALLQSAAKNGRAEIFEALLRAGADPNLASSKEGLTPLHVICNKGQKLALAKTLFELSQPRYRPVRVNARDKRGRTPLQIALSRGRKDLVEWLLKEAGADPNQADDKGLTPLHIICHRGEHVDLAELFFQLCDTIQKKVDVNARSQSGNTPLHLALRHGIKTAVEILLRRGADPNLANEKSLTPLHVACQSKTNELPRLFLNICDAKRHSLKINAQDNKGNTPLHMALRSCHGGTATLVERLLRKYADPNVANDERQTPLHLICTRTDDADFLARMFYDVCDEKNWLVQVDGQDKLGNTPLHLALQHLNHVAKRNVMKLLLIRGSTPNQANEEGSTPLHIMCMEDVDESLVEEFFGICDDRRQRVPIDVRDKLGRTPLQYAVASLMPKVMKMLLQRGADLARFVFPSAKYFGEKLRPRYDEMHFKLSLASCALTVLELLVKKGYELRQSDANTVMLFFAKYHLFAASVDLSCGWYDADERFVGQAKKSKLRRNLSLYDLLQLHEPREAEKRLAYSHYYRYACAYKLRDITERRYQEASAAHLCEIVARGFFRKWALYPFWELIHYRLPVEVCEMILVQLSNKDLCTIGVTAARMRSRRR